MERSKFLWYGTIIDISDTTFYPKDLNKEDSL